MRIAILSDIHGNLAALDAVLADVAARGGVDGCWVLGDLCAMGYAPSEVLDRLVNLPSPVFIRGNTDRFVTTGDRPGPTVEQAAHDPALVPVLAELSGSFGWTTGYLAAHNRLDWLRALPLDHRLTLPDGARVLLVHAAPGADDGDGLIPTLDDGALAAVLDGCDADLVCAGHFHWTMDRALGKRRIINPGSVGLPFPPDLRAAYAILQADRAGYSIAFHRAEYDRGAVLERMRRSGNPGADYLERFLTGKHTAPWMAGWDGRSYTPPVSE
ncbi:MAG: metallophosphoesterase family protein [Anaerolineae bacterium]|nr:metallophosphoesterase family protein [Anaerolineae bacterium]